ITEPQSAAPTATDHLPPPPIVTVPPDAGRFSLQAGAFPDEAVAKALAARLDSRGYQVHIVPAQVEGKGSWYRVRVGSYGDRSAAESERSKLSGEGVFAIVVTEN
ncbi:MAG: SPOR domain-containing protein, partial [Deltaproteobacteria bacterium]|nr:SPOR domain-containing protein [Deltaproteobacteria bacterium]